MSEATNTRKRKRQGDRGAGNTDQGHVGGSYPKSYKKPQHGDAAAGGAGATEEVGHKSNKKREVFGGNSSIPSGSLSKLKASIRQTQRLLYKDTLTPDVRQTTERRLVLLKEELEKTSKVKKKKTMEDRYKAVKFVERKKLLRKISQLKKRDGESTTKDDDQIEQKLRVDLNYVLHYPLTIKYVSLFPTNTYVPHPSLLSEAPQPSESELCALVKKSPDRVRQSIRSIIYSKMMAGKLSQVPELDLAAGTKTSTQIKGNKSETIWGDGDRESDQELRSIEEESAGQQTGEEDDDFFEEESED